MKVKRIAARSPDYSEKTHSFTWDGSVGTSCSQRPPIYIVKRTLQDSGMQESSHRHSSTTGV